MTRFGFLLSVLVHVVLLVFLMLQFSFKSKPFTLSPKAIPLRALPIKEKTQLPKTQKKKPTKKAVQKKPAPKKNPKKTVSKKVIPKKSAPKKTVKKKAPQKKKTLPKKKVPEKKKTKPPEPAQKEPKKEVKKSPPKKQEDDDFLSVMKSVEDLPTQTVEKQDVQDLDAPKSIEEILSLSELDALRQQISSCWRLPSGVRGAGDLVIQLKVTMNPDQTVQSVTLDNDAQSQKSPSFQVAYESARRALYHPKCVPLKLPKGKFSQWQQFTLLFNPKEMII